MRVFPLFAFFFEQAKIIAPPAKARLVSIVDFVRVHNLRVFQDFFLNHFYDAVFLSEQISVIHIRNLVNVKKSSLQSQTTRQTGGLNTAYKARFPS